MPRFQLSSYDEDPSSMLVSRQQQRRSSSSCRLVTHDGRAVHTLTVSGSRCCIETRRLPLMEAGSENNNRYYESSTKDFFPALIRTELPPLIQSALEIDPAIELLCVEGESRRTIKNHEQQLLLPRLLLYTRKSAFLLQITYSDDEVDVVQGEVLSVEEPLDRFFEASTETSIVRVRPGPQSSAGYATLSPAACFAALIENRETCEYSLLLHHDDGNVTAPLHLGVEDVLDGSERFTDFCFAQSNGLSIFPSLSVLLLKGSGDVLAASPVVFDGTVIAKSVVDEGHDYLQAQLDRCSDRNTAKWRQCKAATQFLTDVFGHSENRGHYCTARVLYQAEKSAAKWPTKLQGPLLFHSEVEPGPFAVAIENFGTSDCLVGVAIGKVACKVDFAALSPTSLLPRFAFESHNDALDLDDALFKLGSFVERVDLCPDGADVDESSSISIVKDPVVDTLLHYATPAAVLTVSTNAMRIASRRLKGQPVDPVRTTAWTCLNSADAVQGIVVPSDAVQGHALIAGLKSGSMMPINVTESKYLHEFESLFQGASSLDDDRLLLEDDLTTSATPPLYDEVKPLIAKINAGLSNMGRIVDSDTSYKDITPDSLAVALQIKKRCDDEVVLPLLELKKTVEKHRAGVASRLEQQQKQLQSAIESVKDLQKRMSAIDEMMETAETNATTLSQRSMATVQTSQRLLPTITKAEYDYFQSIKRLNLKCAQMERDVKQLIEIVLPRCDELDESMVSDAVKNMDEESVKRANALLRYEGDLLKKIRERFAKTEELTQQLAREHGIST